jgi:hypothetical protein
LKYGDLRINKDAFASEFNPEYTERAIKLFKEYERTISFLNDEFSRVGSTGYEISNRWYRMEDLNGYDFDMYDLFIVQDDSLLVSSVDRGSDITDYDLIERKTFLPLKVKDSALLASIQELFSLPQDDLRILLAAFFPSEDTVFQDYNSGLDFMTAPLGGIDDPVRFRKDRKLTDEAVDFASDIERSNYTIKGPDGLDLIGSTIHNGLRNILWNAGKQLIRGDKAEAFFDRSWGAGDIENKQIEPNAKLNGALLVTTLVTSLD